MLFCDSLSDTGYRTGLECYFVLHLSFVSAVLFCIWIVASSAHIVAGRSVGIECFAATAYPVTQSIFLILNITQRLRAIFRCGAATSKGISSCCATSEYYHGCETEFVNISIPRVFLWCSAPPII